jgi:hypothetical protein
VPPDSPFNHGVFNNRLHSSLDYSHIPALQSLLSGSDVDQQVAENCLANTTGASAANVTLAQYSNKLLPDSITHFDHSALEATLAPQLVVNAVGVQSNSAVDLFGDAFTQGLGSTTGGMGGLDRVRKLPTGLHRHGTSPADFFGREQLV